MTTLLTDEIRKFIGFKSETIKACDAVEPGAVRRYAQAIMDEDPRYAPGGASEQFSRPIAPPLYPAFMFRRPLGSADVLTERASDPDFDGLVPASNDGLPKLPLDGLALLNGGSEIELYCCARHGENVFQRSTYADIYERQSKSGPMLFTVIETEYLTESGTLLMRARKTMIRR